MLYSAVLVSAYKNTNQPQVEILKEPLAVDTAGPAKNSYCSVVGNSEKIGNSLIQWFPSMSTC